MAVEIRIRYNKHDRLGHDTMQYDRNTICYATSKCTGLLFKVRVPC
jgi:hypothetical protein